MKYFIFLIFLIILNINLINSIKTNFPCVINSDCSFLSHGECSQIICDNETSLCKTIPINDGDQCDDKLSCTINDKCNQGICKGTNIQCNDHNECTLDTCIEPIGQCKYDPLPMLDLPCHSLNLCFEDNKCDHLGQCKLGTPKQCHSSSECVTSVCMPNSGECVNVESYGSCNDRNPCTRHDYCHHGECKGMNITDGTNTPCFTTICNEESGEISKILNDGFCYIDSMCLPSGTVYPNNNLLYCDPLQSTTQYTPKPDTLTLQTSLILDCNSADIGTPCQENTDLCWDWVCNEEHTCVRQTPSSKLSSIYTLSINTDNFEITCNPLDNCHSSAICNRDTGKCDPSIFPDHTPCDSSSDNICIKGTCSSSSSTNTPILLSSNECMVLKNDVYYPKTDYTLCDDNDPTTVSSVCIKGHCQAVPQSPCVSNNPCMSAHYDPFHGCVLSYNDGAPCDTGNACVSGTVCVSGQCPVKTGVPTQCNPSSDFPCNNQFCFPLSGCVVEENNMCATCTSNYECPHIPCKQAICDIDSHKCTYIDDDTNIKGCVDSSFCNGAEFCHTGTCHKGIPPSCDDLNDCTLDTCNDSINSCTHTVTPHIPCHSQNKCALSSQCSSIGTCVPIDTLSCDKAPPCKINIGCDPDTKLCLYENMPDHSPCDNQDPCTQNNQCLAGQCGMGVPTLCPPPDMCHDTGICTEGLGSCFYPSKPDGFPCGNNKICSEGACVLESRTCEHITHDSQCQSVTYDPTLKICVVSNLFNGTYCDTGSPHDICSNQDICLSGKCVDQYTTGALCRKATNACDAPEYCAFSDICPEDQSLSDNTPCPSDTFCNINTCQNSTCVVSRTRTCPRSNIANSCQTTYCDDLLNACVTLPMPNQTPCSEISIEDPCITSAECMDGTCLPIYASKETPCGQGRHCSGIDNTCILDTQYQCIYPTDQCYTASYDFNTHQCVNTPKPNQSPCNTCGQDPVCIAGECIPQHPLDCTFLNDICGVGVPDNNVCTCVYKYTNPLCHPSHCFGGCTQTYTYWQSYNDYAIIPSHKIQWLDNFASQKLCGQTTYHWIMDISKGNAWKKLAQSYITVYLNFRQNGACLTKDIAEIMDLSASLLSLCQTDLSVFSNAALDYKEYIAKLDGYNTGITGPGNCISDAKGPDLMSVDNSITLLPLEYYLNDQRVVTHSNTIKAFGNKFKIQHTNESNCLYGDWDYELTECICYYGWSGPDCNACAVPDDPTRTFLCVPTRLESNPYLLRQIPTDKIKYYLGINELTLPFVSIPNVPAIYPGTEGLDCFCNRITHGTVMRNVAVSVTDNHDLHLYIEILESDLGVCELTWSGNSSLPEVTFVDVYIENTDDYPFKIASIVLACLLGFLFLLIIFSLIQRQNIKKRSRR